MAYRAEIEIGVKGVRELQQLRSEINKSATAAESLNKVVGERGGLVQSIQNYVNNLNKAANTLNLVTAGTKAETKAIQEYVTAEEKANAILQRKINLLDQERSKREEIRRVRKLTAEGIFETTRFAEPIGPAAASQVNLSSPLRGRLNQILELERASVTASNAAFQAALKHEQTLNSLELANDQNVFQNKLKQLDLLAKKELALTKQTDAAVLADFDRRLAARSTGRTGGGGRVGNIISNTLIGGGFPLLFGQGPAAAGGGALGGLAGGALGGTFGFALSIVGTALGQAAEEADAFNKSLAALNVSTVSVGQTTKITADDVNNLAKNLSTTKDEALKVLSAFTGFGDAELTKSLAFIYSDDSGAFKTLAAVKDQADLAQVILGTYQKIGIERTAQLINQLKLGDSASVELAFQKALLDAKIKQTEEGLKQITIQDRILAGLATIGTYEQGQIVDPAIFGQERVRKFRQQNKPEDLLNNALKALEKLRAATRSAESLRPKRETKGPEDRTKQLIEEFNAIVEIGKAEDMIRDLRFDGRELLAVEVEYQKELANITRDRNKTLLQANFASEKTVINKIAEARITKATLELEDKKRDIVQKRFEEELRSKAAVRDSIKPILDARKEQEKQLQNAKTYYRLVSEGLLPAEAQRIVNFEQLVSQQLNAVAEQIKITELAIIEAKARGASTVELEKQLKIYKDQQKAIKDEAAKGPGAAATDRERLMERIATLRGDLNELLDPINQIKQAAEGIGVAFANSFKGIISGSMTAREALASFFQSIADRFLDMAAQIIAKWIEMTILNSILNLFPGGGGGGGGGFGAALQMPQLVPGLGGVPNYSGAFSARAAGGPVTGRTPYIVGERGPELFVPNSSGTIVPNSQLGGMGGDVSVVVNVDASGTEVRGNENQGRALGTVVSAAVQAEIVRQQRPGGLLAGTR